MERELEQTTTLQIAIETRFIVKTNKTLSNQILYNKKTFIILDIQVLLKKIIFIQLTYKQ